MNVIEKNKLKVILVITSILALVFTAIVGVEYLDKKRKDRALKYFGKGMVVFFAGGTGHPYFSTDTGAVLRAVEIEADTILLAKAIDGVYDSDPKSNPNAKKYSEISIEEVLDKKLAVIDLAATIMCYENKMPMQVFGLGEENSIVDAANGINNGTKVTV